jgi:hypothetical protein
VSIVVLDSYAVISCAGCDGDILWRRDLSGLAATICQFACLLPDFIAEVEFRQALLVITQQCSIGFASYTGP